MSCGNWLGTVSGFGVAVVPLGENRIPSSWGYLVGSSCRKQLLRNTAIFVNTDKVGTSVLSGVKAGWKLRLDF